MWKIGLYHGLNGKRLNRRSGRLDVLSFIKILHTVIWAILAASILAIPVFAALRHFRWAFGLSLLVLVECCIVAANGGRCPLTALAARFTPDRTDNFDIYLPLWLARYNKLIFGLLFVASEALLLGSWLKERHSRQSGARARE